MNSYTIYPEFNESRYQIKPIMTAQKKYFTFKQNTIEGKTLSLRMANYNFFIL